jgi:hypothetical protein
VYQNPFAGRPSGFWSQPKAISVDERSAAIGSLVWRPGILSRNGVRYVRCRSWRAETRTADMAALKRVKLELNESAVAAICEDVALLIAELFGAGFFRSVTPVACGHSRRPNCLSAVMAMGLADLLETAMVRAFRDRFVSGSSHPKEFASLPPLEIVAMPAVPCLVVDDVATSGFHMHEALTALRSAGVPSFGAVWVSGTTQG